ncbi:MAG: UvrD/REP helicase, partial [Alphaproteobacteria bacterium]|nr:UvrD/REP helicase [Alphaproteobacteria bacterium]
MSNKPTPQQQDASHPGHSVWVSASAGTGKTRVLVNRMLRLLLEGNRPEKLLCITFTKAAAAEVLQRIQEIVLHWSVLNEGKLKEDLENLLDRPPRSEEIQRSRRLLPIILQSPGGMKIMTIHAFCQSVLSRFPLEANVTPGFAIADDSQSQLLLNQAKFQLLDETREHTNPELFNDLARFFDRVDEKNQNNLIQSVLLKRYRLKELMEKHGGDVHAVKETICHTTGITVNQLTANREEGFANSISREMLRQIIPELFKGTGVNPGKRAEKIQAWIGNPEASALQYTEIYLTQESKIHHHLLAGLGKAPGWVIEFLTSEAQRCFDYIQTQNKIDL